MKLRLKRRVENAVGRGVDRVVGQLVRDRTCTEKAYELSWVRGDLQREITEALYEVCRVVDRRRQ